MKELFAAVEEDLQASSPKIMGKSVLIKASIGYPKPPPFSVDIRIVEQVVKICREIGAEKVSIIEGSTALDGSKAIAKALGFDSIEGAEFVDADDTSLVKVEVPNKIRWDYLYLPKMVLDASFKGSVAILKVEDGAKFYSGVVKNLLGIPPRRIYRGKRPWARGKLHQSLSSSILDLFRTANFDYGILDATTILQGMANVGRLHQFGRHYFGTDLIQIDKKALQDSGFASAFASLAKYLQ